MCMMSVLRINVFSYENLSFQKKKLQFPMSPSFQLSNFWVLLLRVFYAQTFFGKIFPKYPFLGLDFCYKCCMYSPGSGWGKSVFINLRKWQDRSYLSAAMLGWTGGLWTAWRGAPELCSHAGLSLPRKQLWTFLAPGLVVSAVLCSSVASSPSWSPRV